MVALFLCTLLQHQFVVFNHHTPTKAFSARASTMSSSSNRQVQRCNQSSGTSGTSGSRIPPSALDQLISKRTHAYNQMVAASSLDDKNMWAGRYHGASKDVDSLNQGNTSGSQTSHHGDFSGQIRSRQGQGTHQLAVMAHTPLGKTPTTGLEDHPEHGGRTYRHTQSWRRYHMDKHGHIRFCGYDSPSA